MAAPLVLCWSIHSRDACHALERLIAWLDPHGPIWRRLKNPQSAEFARREADVEPL